MEKALCLPVFVAGLLAFASACQKKDGAGAKGGRGPGGPVPVNAGEVILKEMPVELRAVGNVQPFATVAIKAQVGGELLQVHFEEGQEVNKGDLLFTIQPKLFVTQLAQAEANLARDKVQAANAERELARASELARKGAVSREQLDAARAQSESLAATVRADEAAVEIARVQVGYTTVEAPISGRTGLLRVNAGNLVRANDETALVSVNQLEPIYVQFAVPEHHLAEIRKRGESGSLVVIASDPTTGKPLTEGQLTFIENQVDIATGTIPLRATFANEDRALWPGQFVDVVLRLSVQKDALVMPAAALMNGQTGQQVFVIRPDNTAELRPVAVERMVGEEAVIREGVKAGDRVVVNGQLRVVPGGQVTIREGLAPPPPGGAERVRAPRTASAQ